MTRRFTCLLWGLALALPIWAAEPSSENLLPNAGFETDADQDGWPDGWARPKTGITSERENDNTFLRFHASKPDETILLYQLQKLPESVRAVELAWRWRVSDLRPGRQSFHDARLLLGFLDADGKKLRGGPPAPYVRQSTDGWAARTVRFLIPPEARTLELMPALMQVEAGTLDLDDVTLRPIDPVPLETEAREAAQALAAKKTKEAAARSAKAAKLLAATNNLVTNGGFEIDGKKPTGQPDDWGLPKNVTWIAEGDAPHANHFLRLHSPQPGETVLIYHLIDLPADTQALSLTWRQRVTDLKTGKQPWFDARILMHFQDATGQQLAGDPPPPATRHDTMGWVEKSTEFLVPAGAVTLEFMPSLFQVEQGTFDLDDLQLRPTDPAPLQLAAARRAEDERRANVPIEPPNRAKWPSALHVVGNQVLNADDKPVHLQGVNVVSLEFLLKGDHLLKSCLVAVDDWKCTIIRLPVKESYWFGREPGQTDGGAGYRQLVDDAITMVANRGAYVLLDLHRFHAPQEAHAEFWTAAATAYKDHSAVLFDLFNEPHGVSWEVWQNGGFVAGKSESPPADAPQKPEGFSSVGMQKLIDAVRATGAKNIVVAGGLDWAYDLSGVAQGHELDQRSGHGLIYATHIYPWKFDWKKHVLVVAAKHPVLVGEVGCDIKKMDFIPAENQEDPYTWAPDVLGFLQQHKLHWTAFSFHPTATPVLISDWNYTPTPFWGVFVQQALAGKPFPQNHPR